MKTKILFIGLLTLAFAVKAQTPESLIGQQAPPVLFQQSLDKQVKPDFYKGKILVIDFWATWCAPCIANFPHFNELSKTYGSKDVIFAITTDEPLATAKKFFARTQKKVNALNLIDTSRRTLNGFKVQSIPTSVVIDKNNTVVWAGLGSDLTADILAAVVKDRPLPPNKADVAVAPAPGAATGRPAPVPRPAMSFTITPVKVAKGGGSSSNFKGDVISLSRRGTKLSEVLSYLTGYGTTARMITNDTAKLHQLVDLNFDSRFDNTLFNKYANMYVPGMARKNLILNLMGDALKFNVKVTRQAKRHYELVVTDTAKLHSFASLQTRHSSFDDDHLPHFEIVGYNLKEITINLEESAKMIIVTQIADTQRYDLSLNVADLKTLQQTLGFHGLGLKEVNDEVAFLNIDFY